MTDIFASAVGAALGASFPGVAITVGRPPADATAPSLFFTVDRFYSSGGDPKVAVKKFGISPPEHRRQFMTAQLFSAR